MAKTAKTKRKTKLTEKQALFAINMYTIGSQSYGNATLSAKRAGYKGNDNVLANMGNYLIRNPKVLAEKARIQAEITEENKLSRQEVIESLRWAVEDGKANGDRAGVVSAAAWLGKAQGMFSDNLNIKSLTGHVPPEDIKAAIERSKARAKAIDGKALGPDPGDPLDGGWVRL